jgi:hypothetical protein
MTSTMQPTPRPATANPWPGAAIESLFSLGPGNASLVEKRKLPRSSYAVQIDLRLTGVDSAVSAYTHSVSPDGVGFVIDHALPIGRRGRLYIPAPDGQPIEAIFVIRRCRKLATGWFDVSAEFSHRQIEFAEYNFP